MKSKKLIRGAGGGKDGGGSHVATEDPDSLQSKAYATVVDLLCEGEIEGLVNGAESIFLDGVPLLNPDGTFNFQGVTWASTNGTQSQVHLPGFDDVLSEIEVGQKIGFYFPITRQITNETVDRARVRVSVPQLTNQDTTNGDVHGNSVTVSVWLQPSGGSFQKIKSRTISGKSSGKFEVELDFDLTGSAPWNVRVQRDTPDSLSQASINDVYLESYTEIVDSKLRYPNSAIVALRVDSQNFSSIPQRFYDLKLLKVRVPSNYNPATRTYTGSWDGTFQVLWSDNPAWCFYDLMTSTRYGLGAFIADSQIDKWSLYEIGKYCDELVSDGFGGMEPRFTCNLLLNDRNEAYSVIQNFASIFRAMVYWAAGSVTAVQDAPADAAYLFTPANVIDGKFTYQGAATKARHTVALVSWNDPENYYKQAVEYVEDQDAIAKFGVNEIQVVAFGCTTRGQAHRFGKWLLYTEQYESETVVFKTGLEGLVSRPGQIVQIADPNRAGLRMGGRIATASTTQLTIDADPPVNLAGCYIAVLMPDATVEERSINTFSGRTIFVDPPFTQVPNAQAIWILKSPQLEPQTFRIMGAKEEDDGTYTITALKHNPDKFAEIEQGIVLAPRNYTTLSGTPATPQNVKITESLYQSVADVKTKITISWDKVPFATQYSVRYQRDNNNYLDLAPVSVNEVEVLDVQTGSYSVEVVAMNIVGQKSPPGTASSEVYGKTSPPSDVFGFSLMPTGAGTATLSWNQAKDLDVLVGGGVRIRYTPRTTGQAWKDCIDVAQFLPGSATSAMVPLVDGTYMAKFVDSSGNYSNTEAMIVTTVPYVQALNVVDTQVEDPAFSGTMSSIRFEPTQNAIMLTSAFMIDDVTDIDSLGNFDFMGGVASTGTYTFANTVDLGGVWPSNLTALIQTSAFDVGNYIDQRLDLIDNWQDVDGAIINDVNAQIFMRTTNDDPAGTPTWSDWRPFIVGTYNCRAYQFKLVITTAQPTHNMYVQRLQVTIDMEDRVVNISAIQSGTGASYRVTYTEAFFAAPAVAVTGNNLGTGEFFQITSSDSTGFNIVFKNASGTIIDRNFNVLAKGYGRRVA